jgi:peroxiredoxin
MIHIIKSLFKYSLRDIVSKQSMSWLMAAILLLFVGQAHAMNLMKDLDGVYHSLEEYTGQGKWAIVMIWASDCQACNQEAKNYVKFNKAHKDKDAFILGISTDGREKKAEAVKFIERHGVDFKNLIDEPGNVARLYSSLTGQPFVGTPTFLLFSPTGELRAAQVGAVPTDIIESFIAKEALADKNKAAEKVATSP